MNKYPVLRRWLTFILPVISVFICVVIVTHEYARRNRLAIEVRRAETEYERLRVLLPKNRQPTQHSNHDRDHD